MKLLVVSDSHRTMGNMIDAVVREKPDHIIHLGDHTSDAEDLARQFQTIPVLIIRGNCDFDPAHRESVLTELDGVRLFATHGHRYGVKSGLMRFILAAQEQGAQLALFGHTHHAICEEYHGLWLLNPGSCGYGSRPSYGIVEIVNGTLSCQVRYFE